MPHSRAELEAFNAQVRSAKALESIAKSLELIAEKALIEKLERVAEKAELEDTSDRPRYRATRKEES